jgi:hypothetical protein
MRQTKLFFMVALLTIAGRALADDALSVANISMEAGETKEIEICLINTTEFAGINFDLVLPEGISVAKNNKNRYICRLSERKDDHTISISDPTEGAYTCIIYSGNSYTFSGNEGVLAYITLQADIAVSGELTAEIKKITCAEEDQTKHYLSDISFNITVQGLPTAVVTMNNIGGAYWSTYYNSTNNMEAPEGTQVFTASLNKAELTLTEVSDHIIKAGNGVILKSTASPITLTITESSATESYFANNCLVGTMTTITNPGNAYVLNYKENIGVAFYKLRAQGTIGANKAYLIYSSTNARESFSFSNISNGIESITSDMKSSHQVFDLQGRRVIQPKSGVYIMDGKKVVIK